MPSSIRQLYYALLKPRSRYLTDLNSSSQYDRNRIVDADNGEYNGVTYRLETVVHEHKNPLSVDTVSRRDIEHIVEQNGYNADANLPQIFALKEQKQQRLLAVWLDGVSQGGLIENLITRPSYKKEPVRTYLILDSLLQPDLEEIRLQEAATSRNHTFLYRTALRNPSYTGTPYELFLLGLAEERFRKIAEKQAEQNRLNTELSKPGDDWQLAPEKLMFSMAARRVGNLTADYYLFDGRAVPILQVNDFEHGHEAAKDCIDFALKDGSAILADTICLLRHQSVFMKRREVNLLEHLLNLPDVRDFYVEVAMEHQIHQDIQIAPYFGTLTAEDLEKTVQRLIPKVLESCCDLSHEETEQGPREVVTFRNYSHKGTRILCYSSRNSLRRYNESRKDVIRIVADVRSPQGKDGSLSFDKLLNNLYKTDRKRWFNYFHVPEEERGKYY